jgi:hypothetical protein
MKSVSKRYHAFYNELSLAIIPYPFRCQGKVMEATEEKVDTAVMPHCLACRRIVVG